MQKIWSAAAITVALDESSVKQHWGQIESGVRNYLIQVYWTLDEKKK